MAKCTDTGTHRSKRTFWWTGLGLLMSAASMTGILTFSQVARTSPFVCEALLETDDATVDNDEALQSETLQPGDYLLRAAQLGDLAQVQSLLTCGADPNQLASWRERFDTGSRVQTLMAPPLNAAAWHGHTEIVQALLAAGADVNAIDEWDLSALITAAEAGSTEVTALLIDAGADVNYAATCEDCLDETALTAAAARGYADIVTLLLNAGASRQYEERYGHTALELAEQYGHEQVVERLTREAPR